VIERNKLSEGSDKRAEFTYYQMETPTKPIGIDEGPDIARTAIRTRVISKEGNYYHNPILPEGKILGKNNVAEFLVENEDARQAIREQVLQAMVAKETHTEFIPEDPKDEDES
jgi:hypothetical protein